MSLVIDMLSVLTCPAWMKSNAPYMRRSLDTDGSGRITVSELQAALASLGVPVDAAIAGRMVDLIDVDGSSDISFQEFRRFAVLLPQAQVTVKTSQLSYSLRYTIAALRQQGYCEGTLLLQNVAKFMQIVISMC